MTEVSSKPSIDTQLAMRYDAEKKSVLIAYLLWFFLGGLGVHRFYGGATGSGAAMLVIFIVSFVLSFVLVGFAGFIVLILWWLVDAFLTYSMIQSHNSRLAAQLSANIIRP